MTSAPCLSRTLGAGSDLAVHRRKRVMQPLQRNHRKAELPHRPVKLRRERSGDIRDPSASPTRTRRRGAQRRSEGVRRRACARVRALRARAAEARRCDASCASSFPSHRSCELLAGEGDSYGTTAGRQGTLKVHPCTAERLNPRNHAAVRHGHSSNAPDLFRVRLRKSAFGYGDFTEASATRDRPIKDTGYDPTTRTSHRGACSGTARDGDRKRCAGCAHIERL